MHNHNKTDSYYKMNNNIITVASDGSCLKNPGGPIGWAWADSEGRWQANGHKTGTNQSAELLGLISIFLAYPNTPLHIQLDSQYTLNIASKWMYSWKKQGWKRKKEPIKNLELVQTIYTLTAERKNKNLTTTFEWVKGHTNHALNNKADIEAGKAAVKAKQGKPAYADSANQTGSPKQDIIQNILKKIG